MTQIRPSFDATTPIFAATKPLTLHGKHYGRGEEVPGNAADTRLMRMLYDQGRLELPGARPRLAPKPPAVKKRKA